MSAPTSEDPEVRSTPPDEDGGGGVSGLVRIPYSVAANPLPPLVDESKVKHIHLTPTHRRMIALHLRGYNHTEIARALGCHPATVGAVLRNPAAQALLERAFREYDESLKALVPLAIDAMRDGLLSPEARVQGMFVDKLFKVLGKYKDETDAEYTAEDVVQRIIKMRNGDQEITFAEQRRRR